MTRGRILLLFVDGVGLGDDDATANTFLNASTPVISSLLDGARVIRAMTPLHATSASLVGIDATLGTAGTPQSGTGQAALLTGADTVALHGRHFGPWVPARLRPLVREQSVLARAARDGHSVAFANAYPEEVLQELSDDGAVTLPSDAPARGRRSRKSPPFLRAGPPLAALGAGLLTRHTQELMSGDAVASEITNDGWRDRLGRAQLPVIDARRAGHNLAGIVARHELTLFAHYSTDYAGHRRDMDAAVSAIERVDAFLGGLVEAMAADTLIMVVSDHGNLEDVRTGHTRNPAIGLVIGSGHDAVAQRLHSLTDVTPTVLDVLSRGTP